MKKEFKHIFGPVPSRRLGLSLGVDLVPFKTCSYNCVYCQLGHTTNLTAERKSYVPTNEVLEELKQKLRTSVKADYITLSGSGEPTLHSEIGAIIDGIKKITKIPVAVLTNGSLLFLPEVRRALMNADLVIPSLDAASGGVFERINRPHPDIDFEKMFDGLVSFRNEYKGRIWLEIFFVKDLNDGDEEISNLVNLVEKIRPDRVDLNTAVRPPADPSARAVNKNKLNEIASKFERPVLVIADVEISHAGGQRGCINDIMDMLARRPCTADDVALSFNLHINEVLKYLEVLKSEGKIRTEEIKGKNYYLRTGE
jgi:wyosine [tRNA(Phe)-imidazoG37] synthetase (radical SAM superfamily)